MEVAITFKQVTDNSSQEYNIAACASGNIHICQCRCTREMRVYMNNLGTKLFGLNHIRKGYRMCLSHIAAHDQDTVAIHKILRKCGGTATP